MTRTYATKYAAQRTQHALLAADSGFCYVHTTERLLNGCTVYVVSFLYMISGLDEHNCIRVADRLRSVLAQR